MILNAKDLSKHKRERFNSHLGRIELPIHANLEDHFELIQKWFYKMEDYKQLLDVGAQLMTKNIS